jgi:1-acyl-sn-glycerol-3-phosphate acyltransferase
VIVYEFLEPIPPGLKRGEFMRRLQDSIETASNRLLAEGL